MKKHRIYHALTLLYAREMLQIKSGQEQSLMDKNIPHDWISWDNDESHTYVASDFEWVLVPDFSISEIGDQNFIEEMKSYLDDEIHGMLEYAKLPNNATSNDARNVEEHRLADWIALEHDLSHGGYIKEPVQIALIQAPDADFKRNSILDGWHRIAGTVKHGKTTIPAYIGTLKK
jgi:hypothetical protein